ncbi:MAG: NTP transferase domain-containing protein, partial [Paracoccaceae bacterium]
VFNPDYETGQQTSVAVGLRHAPDASSLLIGLGDQPVLQAADIRALLDAHAAAGRGKISIPVSDETRGNPIVVPHGLRAGLTADPARAGCMRFTRENPALVQRHTLRAEGFYKDIDTPDDYIDLTHEEGLTL